MWFTACIVPMRRFTGAPHCQGELAVQVLHLKGDLTVLAADAGDKVVVGPALARD